MRCEHQSQCGFFKVLKEHGKLKDGTCGKSEPRDCHRFRHAEHKGSPEQVIRALQTINVVGDPLTSEDLANSKEVEIFNPYGYSR